MLIAVGYYRLTGYLYPFRESEGYVDEKNRERRRVLGTYPAGTSVQQAFDLIHADRQLRMLVLEATERIEIALRMQLGYVMGETSAYSHSDLNSFLPNFTTSDAMSGVPDPVRATARILFPRLYRSKLESWHERVADRQRDASDENFVSHFTAKYDSRLPIWVLTEILEFGQLSRLYGGINSQMAETIANSFNVPSRKLMVSWLASLNYVRNVSAHHARLFNRKLQQAPARPKKDAIPALAHLTDEVMPKSFGAYSLLCVMAYLLRVVEPDNSWAMRVREWAENFPASGKVDLSSVGFHPEWKSQELWN